MKKLSILLTIFIMISFITISCSEDETTELAWQNNSTEAINEITWATTDTMWIKPATGYVSQEQTESKEVSAMVGEVDCRIDDGDEFVEATVTISETNSSSLALTAGESYVYTITAAPAKKK